jgi:hypothetical protein
VAYFGIRSRRREDRRESRRPRPLGCLWLIFWLLLIIVLLGLLFGGYHKGSKVSAPVLRLRQPVSTSWAEQVRSAVR